MTNNIISRSEHAWGEEPTALAHNDFSWTGRPGGGGTATQARGHSATTVADADADADADAGGAADTSSGLDKCTGASTGAKGTSDGTTSPRTRHLEDLLHQGLHLRRRLKQGDRHCSCMCVYRSAVVGTGLVRMTEKLLLALAVCVFVDDVSTQLSIMLFLRVCMLLWFLVLRPFVAPVRVRAAGDRWIGCGCGCLRSASSWFGWWDCGGGFTR